MDKGKYELLKGAGISLAFIRDFVVSDTPQELIDLGKLGDISGLLRLVDVFVDSVEKPEEVTPHYCAEMLYKTLNGTDFLPEEEKQVLDILFRARIQYSDDTSYEFENQVRIVYGRLKRWNG